MSKSKDRNKKKKKRNRPFRLKDTWIERSIKRIPHVLLLAVGCSLVIIMYPTLAGMLYPDSKEAHNTDLLWRPLAIADEQNAFLLTKELGVHAYEPEQPKQSITKLIEGGKSWDTEFVGDVLSKNVQTCEILSRAAKLTMFQDPILAEASSTVLVNYQQPLLPWRKAARVCSLQAVSLARSYHTDQAISRALDVVRIGNMIEHSQTDPLGYILGTSVKLFGLSALRTIAAIAPLYPSQIQHIAAVLEGLDSGPDTIIRPLQGEYMAQIAAIDGIAHGDRLALDTVGLSLYAGRAKSSFYLQPHRTADAIAEVYRGLITEARKSCVAYEPVIFRRQLDLPTLSESYFDRNMLGTLIKNAVIKPSTDFIEKRCADEVNSRMTELIVAMEAYKKAYGEYPKELTLLVPKYLKTLPRDPYSNTSFGYDRASRTLYSIGPKGAKDAEGNYDHDSSGHEFVLPE